MEVSFANIAKKLGVLRCAAVSPDVFGAQFHRYLMNPLARDGELQAFEELNSVRLPDEYRGFLLNVGNGGAGPSYGIFPLGKMDGSIRLKSWRPGDGFVGILSEPFPYVEPWNDLTNQPVEDETATPANPSEETEFDRQIAAWDEWYWDPSRINGAIPICHHGCAHRQWLVITGTERGKVWNDDRAGDGGLRPETDALGRHVTFLQWYCAWLDDAFERLRETR